MKTDSIALEPRYVEQLRALIKRAMAGTCGTVRLFGSRARGNPHKASDIDLAVQIPQDRAFIIGRLRELFEESTIPFTVDVVDLNLCDEALAREVEREGVTVWNG